MPLPEKVEPGQLITHQLINDILDELAACKREIELWKAGQGAPIITQILPAGVLHVDDPLEIRGLRFGYSRGAQMVTLNGVLVSQFDATQSSDTRLVFDIPMIPGLPEEGAEVTIRVANGYGSDARVRRILPRKIELTGNLFDVFWTGVDPNPLVPGQAVTFRYRLHSRHGETATVDVRPEIATPGWPTADKLEILDAAGALITERRITVGPKGDVPFGVRIPQVPAGTTGQTFRLEVEVQAGEAVGSHAEEYAVGTPLTEPTTEFTAAFVSFNALNPATGLPDPTGGSEDDNTISIRPGFIGQVRMIAEFTQTGTYEYQVALRGADTSGWEAQLFNTGTTEKIEEADFESLPAGQDRVTRNPEFSVIAQNNAVSGAQVRFTIVSHERASGNWRDFTLVRLP
jgi:hypothetical protein